MKRIFNLFAFAAMLVFALGCSVSITATPTTAPATQTVLPVAITEAPTEQSTSSQTINVFFTDEARFAIGTEPYEVAVSRPLPEGADPIRAVLDAFFLGPTPEEVAQGLMLVASGFNGIRQFSLENGVARIYLAGTCANNGAAYSVTNLIHKNLSQFPEITVIKIYDELDNNLDPDSSFSSGPYCLEP